MCDLRTLRPGERLVHLLSLTHSTTSTISSGYYYNIIKKNRNIEIFIGTTIKIFYLTTKILFTTVYIKMITRSWRIHLKNI